MDSLFGIIPTAAQVNKFALVQLLGVPFCCDYVRIKGYHSSPACCPLRHGHHELLHHNTGPTDEGLVLSADT